nr:hypothetical protein [Tanacetum cinerariifolium]
MYRPIMESSTSSQPYQPYSPINPTNLDMNFEYLMFSQEYNYSQDYSMGHGLGHGSGHGFAHGLAHGLVLFHDDEDDSPVEEVSPVKPKKPSRRAAKAKKDETKEIKEPSKEWTVEEEIVLCQGWTDVEMPHFFKIQERKKSKTFETTSESASGGINLNEKADKAVQETQEFRPMGRDRANVKKNAAGSASSIVDLVADKFYNMKQKKKRKERQGTTGLYGDEESRVEYPGGRGLRNCTTEKGETRNSTLNT